VRQWDANFGIGALERIVLATERRSRAMASHWCYSPGLQSLLVGETISELDPPGLNAMSLTLEQYEKLNPRCEIEHAGKRMIYATPNTGTKWRVETIYTKEPCTLEWIAGFETGDVLVDVGANVGMYTIWAAVTKGARVFAFEPESQNYALLNRNILFNNLQDRVKAYCVGLADKQGLTDLYMATVSAGDSCHSVGEALDYKHEPLPVVFRQGCVAFRLDDLVSCGVVPVPSHIKIDVDGIEPKVVAGARETISNPSVRSLLIEVNKNLLDHCAMVRDLGDLGFRYDPAQVDRAVRKDGQFKGVAEYVFKR
jgi:FkbM family methyltransferase